MNKRKRDDRNLRFWKGHFQWNEDSMIEAAIRTDCRGQTRLFEEIRHCFR